MHMNKKRKLRESALRWLLYFFIATGTTNAQPPLAHHDSLKVSKREIRGDTTPIVLKEFSQAQIEALKADPDLKYSNPPTVGQSLWERFLSWLAKLIGSLFKNTTFKGIGKIILYALGSIALIYLIMALLRVNPKTLFLRSSGIVPPAEFFHENIHEMDFEKLIQEATAKNDFRIATRLVFLYALKILADHQLIDWNPGKTNYDYIQEIQQADLKDGFADLSTYFEYAWYGNFKVTPEIFASIRIAFQQWRTKVEI